MSSATARNRTSFWTLIMTLTQSQPIVVLLDRNAHRYAQQFAGEQATSQKGKQVYLNTLAVCAVDRYLKWLSISTNLSQSDCWHPGLRAIFDVADLILPRIGKLECRPILPGETALVIPPEVSSDRIGYLVIQLTESLDRVQLLGFIRASQISQSTAAIPLTKLRSLDDFLDTIHRQNVLVDLRQWMEESFQPEWQSVELIFASQGRSFRTANSNSISQTNIFPVRVISRGKVITWERESDRLSFILVVKMTRQSSDAIDICLQLYPGGEMNCLPSELQFSVIDESGNTCLEATTRDEDNWIQLEFTCHSEEEFTIKIDVKRMSFVEQFIV
jgi:hypothetical protein